MLAAGLASGAAVPKSEGIGIRLAKCGLIGRPTIECHAVRPLTYASCEGRFTVSDRGSLHQHRTWEDWGGMVLGLLIALTPWFPTQQGEWGDAGRSVVVLNTVMVGIIVFGLAQLEYVSLQRWEQVAGIIVGLWLILSPFVLGYHSGGLLRFYHSAFGALVVLLSTLQLWQDWKLSDQDMLKHGQ
jgi:hypothetical protein